MKKVYFACSITGGRDHAHRYQDIVDIIHDHGMHVLSEAFADKSVNAATGIGMKHGMSAPEIWEWDLNWLREADGIIAEVSQPSLGVGYEIAIAHTWEKPVLALYYPQPERKLSSMIAGSPNVIVYEYTDVNDTRVAIKDFLQSI
ncbi:MAG TPA: nucleoside 2-deoxyribosyltransferase [Candidatus Saccharimonadales bacterium]|nr:nucleoside 2-deoxyribosyltransferase [Candidatus Saccharimonadales bacterium]